MRLQRLFLIMVTCLVLVTIWIMVETPGVRGRNAARRIYCAAQLKALYKPIDERATTASISVNQLRCPIDDIPYIVLPLTVDGSKETILAFDAFTGHYNKCGNVLFGDGHVECVEKNQYPAMMQRAVSQFKMMSTQPATSAPMS